MEEPEGRTRGGRKKGTFPPFLRTEGGRAMPVDGCAWRKGGRKEGREERGEYQGRRKDRGISNQGRKGRKDRGISNQIKEGRDVKEGGKE